ncbi:hypothetical protein KBY95_00685 [Cyanobium sp. Aljojuca 7A6]|nr:hypothetical protein [Cyanobium sp. La Preciosa 7G6]MCP9935594.1 hypothetical protein [Cyanobium sp. Aljojuca 7A6]
MPGVITRHKYQPPPWVAEHLTPTAYNNWLRGKAQGLARRDEQRGGHYSVSEAKAAVHAAIADCGGRDYWTGEQLRWDLLGNYDSDESGLQGATYKRARALQPTIDHRDSRPICDFVICAWRTNDAKHDMSSEELKEFCRLVLEHNP